MNLWRWLRQSGRIETMADALESEVRSRMESERASVVLRAELESERVRRITAETLAVERRAEVERLVAELATVRGDHNRMIEERMKSLDSLNVKLMTERVPEVPPDMAQFKRDPSAAVHAIRQIQKIHHDVDAAVLKKMHPKFGGISGAVMNQVMEEYNNERDKVAPV